MPPSRSTEFKVSDVIRVITDVEVKSTGGEKKIDCLFTLEEFQDALKGFSEGKFHVLSGVGTQNVGKSTFWQKVFGAKFKIQGGDDVGKTTVGINGAVAQRDGQWYVLFDVEGFDSGDDDQVMSKEDAKARSARLALFALTVSDTICVHVNKINMWNNTGSGLDLLEQLFELRAGVGDSGNIFNLAGSSKRHLLFIIHDVIEKPEAFRKKTEEYIDRVLQRWERVFEQHPECKPLPFDDCFTISAEVLPPCAVKVDGRLSWANYKSAAAKINLTPYPPQRRLNATGVNEISLREFPDYCHKIWQVAAAIKTEVLINPMKFMGSYLTEISRDHALATVEMRPSQDVIAMAVDVYVQQTAQDIVDQAQNIRKCEFTLNPPTTQSPLASQILMALGIINGVHDEAAKIEAKSVVGQDKIQGVLIQYAQLVRTAISDLSSSTQKSPQSAVFTKEVTDKALEVFSGVRADCFEHLSTSLADEARKLSTSFIQRCNYRTFISGEYLFSKISLMDMVGGDTLMTIFSLGNGKTKSVAEAAKVDERSVRLAIAYSCMVDATGALMSDRLVELLNKLYQLLCGTADTMLNDVERSITGNTVATSVSTASTDRRGAPLVKANVYRLPDAAVDSIREIAERTATTVGTTLAQGLASAAAQLVVLVLNACIAKALCAGMDAKAELANTIRIVHQAFLPLAQDFANPDEFTQLFQKYFSFFTRPQLFVAWAMRWAVGGYRLRQRKRPTGSKKTELPISGQLAAVTEWTLSREDSVFTSTELEATMKEVRSQAEEFARVTKVKIPGFDKYEFSFSEITIHDSADQSPIDRVFEYSRVAILEARNRELQEKQNQIVDGLQTAKKEIENGRERCRRMWQQVIASSGADTPQASAPSASAASRGGTSSGPRRDKSSSPSISVKSSSSIVIRALQEAKITDAERNTIRSLVCDVVQRHFSEAAVLIDAIPPCALICDEHMINESNYKAAYTEAFTRYIDSIKVTRKELGRLKGRTTLDIYAASTQLSSQLGQYTERVRAAINALRESIGGGADYQAACKRVMDIVWGEVRQIHEMVQSEVAKAAESRLTGLVDHIPGRSAYPAEYRFRAYWLHRSLEQRRDVMLPFIAHSLLRRSRSLNEMEELIISGICVSDTTILVTQTDVEEAIVNTIGILCRDIDQNLKEIRDRVVDASGSMLAKDWYSDAPPTKLPALTKKLETLAHDRCVEYRKTFLRGVAATAAAQAAYVVYAVASKTISMCNEKDGIDWIRKEVQLNAERICNDFFALADGLMDKLSFNELFAAEFARLFDAREFIASAIRHASMKAWANKKVTTKRTLPSEGQWLVTPKLTVYAWWTKKYKVCWMGSKKLEKATAAAEKAARDFLGRGMIFCSGYKLRLQEPKPSSCATDQVNAARECVKIRCDAVKKGARTYEITVAAMAILFGLIGGGITAAIAQGILESDTVIVVMTDIGDLATTLANLCRQ